MSCAMSKELCNELKKSVGAQSVSHFLSFSFSVCLYFFSPLASACVHFLMHKLNIPPTINKYSAYLISLIYHLVSDVCLSLFVLLLITRLTLKLCLRWGGGGRLVYKSVLYSSRS